MNTKIKQKEEHTKSILFLSIIFRSIFCIDFFLPFRNRNYFHIKCYLSGFACQKGNNEKTEILTHLKNMIENNSA